MKPSVSIAACAALVLGFAAAPALAGPVHTAKPDVHVPAPQQWARPGPFLGARAPWRSAAGPEMGTQALPPPLAAGQLQWPQQKITANDWAAGDLYGYSAVLTPNMAFVGAPGSTIGGNVNEGAVYVYQKAGGAWIQVQKVTPDDGGAQDEFGISMSVSGNMLLVGSVQHGATGAVYAYTRTNGVWSLTQEFTASDAGGFGYVVTLHDGTAVIGAPGTNGYTGTAYVFTRSNGVWSQAAELSASDGADDDWFGKSVAIAGNTIVVGQDNPQSSTAVGAAYVFTQSGDSWTQTQKLQASDATAGDGFGFDVAMSGSTALIGAAYMPEENYSFGAAYVFHKSGGTWTQTQKLVPPSNIEPYQAANTVAMHGNTAVVGSPIASWPPGTFPPTTGVALVYTKSAGTWALTRTLAASDASVGEFFGFAVGLSANGVIATTIPDFGGGVPPDAAYIFGPINFGVTNSP